MRTIAIFILTPFLLLVTLAAFCQGFRQVSTITHHFGPLRPLSERTERIGRYGDSALQAMDKMLRAKTRDSAAYYNGVMNYYRLKESHRQHLYTDSAWQSEIFYRQRGWSPYKTGSQSWHMPLKLNAFMNTSDTYISCPGEYVPMDIDLTTQTFYSHAGASIPATIPGSPAGAAVPIGGPHNGCGMTSNGQVWCYGQWILNGQTQVIGGIKQGVSVSNMTHMIFDSLGNYLDSVANFFLSGNNYGNFWNCGFVTTTGKMYVGGELEGGNEGNNTWGNQWAAYPVQVTATGNPYWVKIQGGYCFVAIDSSGGLWTWGGANYNYWLGQGNSPANYKVPTKINLPAGYKARDIASNGSYSYALVYDASGNQHVYAWAQQYYEDYIGIYPTSIGTSAIDITSYLSPYLESGHKIATIQVGSNATYVVLDNGHGYGWGGTPCGELGTGLVLNWWSNGPFFWNFGPHECQQIHPVRLLPGVNNIKGFYVCQSNSFYGTIYDSAGNSGSAGRNKSGTAQLLALPQDSTTSIVGALYVQGSLSSLPDSWGERYWRKNKGNRIVKNHSITSPWCILNPNSSANGLGCNGFANPASGLPVSGALSASQSNGAIIVSAQGKHTANGTVFARMLWQQGDSATAPSLLDLRYQAENIDTIFTANKGGIIHTGSYTLLWQGITEAYDTVSDSISVTIGSTPPTVSITGANPKVIYLPYGVTTASTTVAGTAVGNGGATITGYAWTQVSGPNSATFGTPSAATTTATGLIAGNYVFKLTAMDSNGNTNFATIIVEIQNFNGLTSPAPLLISH